MGAGTIRITGDDPLTRGIPAGGLRDAPTGSTPVEGFGEVGKWINPRSEADMKEQYKRFDVAPIDGGVSWTFDTRYRWTDVHFHGDVPQGDGVGYRARLSGAARWVSLQYVIKDANWAEFVAPEEVLIADGQWREHTYPLQAFTNAPWSKEKPKRPALPLRGMKFVLSNVANAGECELQLSQLRSLRGDVTTQQVRTFGAGFVAPTLTPTGEGYRVLGTVEGTDRPGLVVTGEGKGTVLFCAAPFIPRQTLRALMRQAGIEAYDGNTDDVLRADTRYIAIHTKAGGQRALHLPGGGRLRCADGAGAGRRREVTVELPEESYRVFRL